MINKSGKQKLTEGGIGIAVTTVLVYAIEEATQIIIPAQVAASLAFLVGYLIPSIKGGVQ